MSTNGSFHLHRAVVHSADVATGVAYVRIPALLGTAIVPVEALPAGSDYALPAVGEKVFVAVSEERTQVSWIIGLRLA